MKFIDFILKAQKDPGLIAEFMLIDDETELKDFFKKNKFTDIGPDEIPKILQAKRIQYRMSAIGGTRAY
jgi:hypothetical protein